MQPLKGFGGGGGDGCWRGETAMGVGWDGQMKRERAREGGVQDEAMDRLSLKLWSNLVMDKPWNKQNISDIFTVLFVIKEVRVFCLYMLCGQPGPTSLGPVVFAVFPVLFILPSHDQKCTQKI